MKSARLVLVVVVLALLLVGCAQSPESSVEQRIQRIEHGLLSAYGDPPWKGMDLADRMAYYNVPGVSIAVINDYKVEWTRGYGVLEAGQLPGAVLQEVPGPAHRRLGVRNLTVAAQRRGQAAARPAGARDGHRRPM